MYSSSEFSTPKGTAKAIDLEWTNPLNWHAFSDLAPTCNLTSAAIWKGIDNFRPWTLSDGLSLPLNNFHIHQPTVFPDDFLVVYSRPNPPTLPAEMTLAFYRQVSSSNNGCGQDYRDRQINKPQVPRKWGEKVAFFCLLQAGNANSYPLILGT